MKNPETFAEAFDAYVFHCTNWGTASPEYQAAWWAENPRGWTTTKEDRRAYFDVMLVLAIKEAKVSPLLGAAVAAETRA